MIAAKINRGLISALTIAVTIVLTITFSFAMTHLDRTKLPAGCSSCHKGHGTRATVMLEKTKDELCFKCHGIGGAKDVYSPLQNVSNHPIIQTSQYHVTGESLPERSPSTPRHVSCYDCHNAHLSSPEKTFDGVKGYSGRGVTLKRADNEYEVCYRCHSDSANLPPGSSNIAEKMDPANASYHPVESTGKNLNMPSLKAGLSSNSTILCTDCHGNDDPIGAKGPHGSNYEFLLKANYSMESGVETLFAYELCYSCHERESIRSNESFKAHEMHVFYLDVSCFACHDPHGVRDFENLIRFDARIVTGAFNYIKVTPGRPECFLRCHVAGIDYEHKHVDGVFCIVSTQGGTIRTHCPLDW